MFITVAIDFLVQPKGHLPIFGDKQAGKKVMDETPGACSPGMDHILGEDSVGRVDQHFGVLRLK